MKKTCGKILQFAKSPAPKSPTPIEGVRIGRVVGVNESGALLVDFAGNRSGPLVARTTTWSGSRAKNLREEKLLGREVLLAFQQQDPTLPIIVDTMVPLIEEIAEPAATVIEAGEPRDVTVDGKRIVFDAENEIVLKCGEASVTLTKTGKILIRGDYVLSHSKGENRIIGGSIVIN